MKENLQDLKQKFELISKRGWIKERKKGFSSICYTFETMLGKEEENFPIPDYDGIEIKTMNKNAKTNLHLFNLTPDGDYLFPIKRILENFGCPDKDDRNKKVFYRSFCGNVDTNIIYGRKGRLFVNYDERKLELKVVNNRKEDVSIGISWSFNWLDERLKLKLTYLALVRASSTIISGEGYYHYDKISFYKLKDFNTFLSLVEKGIIEVTFKIGYYKSGRRMGEIHDCGTDFSINVNNLDLLYEEIVV